MRLVLGVAVGLLTGCASNASDADSGGQLTLELGFQGRDEQTIVFTLDDSPNAYELRQELADFFVHFEEHEFDGNSFPFVDPARWQPVSRDVVILRPSAPAGSRFRTSIDDTRLHWDAPNRTPEGVLRFQAGVAAAIRESVGDGTSPPALLESWARATDLMARRAVPVTPGERRFVDVATDHPPSYPAVSSYLVTANDDASPLPAAAYTREPVATWNGSVIWVGGDRGKSCEPMDACATPRLKEWLPSQRVEFWPCEKSRLFFLGFFDASARCEASPIASVDGVAQCRVMAELKNGCPTDRGWDNPVGANGVREPHYVSGSNELQICEMVQLDGAALESCRHDLQCRDCKPGWCRTEVPELTNPQECPEGSRHLAFRMVLGADSVDTGHAGSGPMRITCNLAQR